MCPDCKARRDRARAAFINLKMGKAAKEIITGAAELVGVKPKTGVADNTPKTTADDDGVFNERAEK